MAAPITIGRLRDRVRFERQEITEDPLYGPQPGAWVEVATEWAEVLDSLPSRAETGDAVLRQSVRPARIRLRWRTDIDTTMRVVLLDRDNRVLGLSAGPAMLGNERRFMEFMAEEFTSTGAP